ncbi:MAG: FIST C-terminal domain-containing protein [Polyangiaceae bacterium]|nr:FIST C-terminal domain-containing protein [Polyangiaceae bacterium]
MPVRASTGFSIRRDSFQAGHDAARMALRKIVRPDLVLAFGAVTHDQTRLLEGIRAVVGEVPLLGGSSFGELTEHGLRDDSVALMALELPGVEIALGTGKRSDQEPSSAGKVAARCATDLRRDGPGRLGLFLAEMRANEQPLLGIQSVLGDGFPLFGGCCSGNRHLPISDPAFSLGFQYAAGQVYQHAVPLGILAGEFSTSFGVAHGWQPLGVEVELGRTEGSIVYEIDGEPAIDFYARYLGDGQPTAFPLGFVTDGHLVLRAARGAAADGGIALTAPVPAGCRVRLTRGNRADILNSSEAATRLALDRLGRDRLRAALVVSCISRRTMLGTRVEQELASVRRVLGNEVPILGLYAAGEYAPPAQRCLYHNCTFCLCLLGDCPPSPDGMLAEGIPSVAAREDRSAAPRPPEAQRRVLVLTDRQEVATACVEAIAEGADVCEWIRAPSEANGLVEAEYAQVVVLEERQLGLIGPWLDLNPALVVVVLVEGEPEWHPARVGVSPDRIAGYGRLPLVAVELRFLVAGAMRDSLARVERTLLERRLHRALRGLATAEDAIETSERLLTETYRAIESAYRDMRIVLDNVQQGFVTLNRSGVMAQGRSKAIDRLLGEWPGPVPFAAYLARSAPALGQLFGLAWDQVVAAVLPLEVTIDLLPRQWVIGPRHLRFEYVPVQNPDAGPDCIDSMVVVVTDATAEVAKREAEAQQQESLEVFQRMLRDPNGVDQFFRDAQRMVGNLTDDAGQQERDPVVVRRLLHTLKGNCAVMGLHRMAAMCHTLEDELGERPELLLSHHQSRRLRDAWNRVAEVVESLQAQRGDEIAVPREAIRELSERAARAAVTTDLAADIRSLLHEPVRRRLERLAESARALAERLDKGKVEVLVRADDLRLDPHRWEPLWSDLVHAVRNAVDHGIPMPQDTRPGRRMPRIELSATRHGSTLEMRVSDNGPGIDWQRVAGRAAEIGIPVATPKDLQEALFAERVTTLEAATPTSGRGVGLGSLRRTVEQLGGTIEVESAPEVGTTLTLRFELQR